MIGDVEGLRRYYREPGQPALRKELDHLDAHCRAFIARSPFFVLGSAGADGRADVSPRGGRPGFVTVLGERRLAFGDLSGNNRLDSFTNLVERPEVGLLFFVPGYDETLRVNGRAAITDGADVTAACSLDGVRVTVAVVVHVEQAYLHCAKAVRRADLWRPEAWPDTADLPPAAEVFRDHCDLGVLPSERVSEILEDGYRRDLWQPGGGAGA